MDANRRLIADLMAKQRGKIAEANALLETHDYGGAEDGRVRELDREINRGT